MRGYLLPLVDRVFLELWQPLQYHRDCPDHIFGEIYTGLATYLMEPEERFEESADGVFRNSSLPISSLVAEASNDQETAERLLRVLRSDDFATEEAVVSAIAGIYDVLEEISTDDLARRYLELLRTFVERYNLRYYVDSQARFWTSFAGFAGTLFGQLQLIARGNPHLLQELAAFEKALAECIHEPDEFKIKTSIQKQINCLEAFGLQNSSVVSDTFGGMLRNLRNDNKWPHDRLAKSAKKLNDFINDYPGIRHAGNYRAATRRLDLRDLACVTLSLVGLVAYIAEEFEVDVGSSLDGTASQQGGSTIAHAPWTAAFGDGQARV